MEAELYKDGKAHPGAGERSTTATGAGRARDRLLQRRAPYNRGLFHTGCGGGGDGNGETGDLLAQHRRPGGRRGQLRAPGARPAAPLHGRRAETMFGEPALTRAGERRGRARRAAGRDARDPAVAGLRRRRRAERRCGAGPAARCSCRRGATTAPRGRSSTSSSASGPTSATAGSTSSRRCRTASRRCRAANIRLGHGSVDVLAAHDGSTYTTRIDAGRRARARRADRPHAAARRRPVARRARRPAGDLRGRGRRTAAPR